jgi:hypothetical protein
MDLMLSIDPATLGKARLAAASRGVSLDDLLCRYLERLAQEVDLGKAFHELKALSLNRGGHSAGQAWTREELHRR